ncbi:uncharacterized protein LOC111703492 isoform X2 [Eurytemora carolleeae]|uniref:uncharacterized protein LOC111703492 isoform X2 n=1 Tax=Eurytemora carolleeae TaxID=1294199 RepID=UPI000C75EB2D|nr:uncharacterized protein LOC111703492 isoform X2 [Eurytemora carolleeae]|eukprot:XP_023331207.1 uncharacterized protein LOC111703492 isoform X2 [Eurytemora affinis]
MAFKKVVFLFVLSFFTVSEAIASQYEILWKTLNSVKDTDLTCLLVVIGLANELKIPTSEKNVTVLQLSGTSELEPYTNLINQSGCVRFIVDSNANIHLVEELCNKPTSCLTIFLADQTTQKISLYANVDPQLVRVLVIPKNPESKNYAIKLVCPYCRKKVIIANLWKKSGKLLYEKSNIKCCFYLSDRGVFRVQTFVTQTEVNDPSNQLRDEIINGKLVVNAKSGANLRFWYLMSTLYHFDIEIIDAPNTLEWKSNLLAKKFDLIPFSMTSLLAVDGAYDNVFIGRMGAYTDRPIMLMCPVPEIKPKYFNIIKPFSFDLWIGLIVALIGSSLVFHLFQVHSKEESLLDLQNSIFHIYGMVFNNYGKIKGPGKYFIGAGWAVFVMFFIFFFNSKLSAYLISSDYNDPIESLEDLVYKSNLILTIASDRQWALENEKYYRTLEELGRLNDVGGANDFKYANKTHCAAHIIATSEDGISRNRVDYGEPIVRIGKVPYIYDEGISFACRKKNNFCEELENKFILAVELGIFKKIESQFIRISKAQKIQTPANSLALEHFLLPSIILLGGILISFLVFILELAKQSK